MKTLIEQIQEKYDFITDKSIKIKGHSSTITLRKYFFEIEETETIEPLRINIQELHENNQPIKNLFRLSIVNCAENDEPHDLFIFSTFNKLDRFLSGLLQ